MNNEVIADLKQFIATTVSQQIAPIIERLDSLEQKVDDGFAGIGESLETIHKQIDQDKQEINSRLTVLEQKPA